MLARYLIYFLLFFLPCLTLPFGVNFETSKVFMAEIAIGLLVLIHINQSKQFDLKRYSKPYIFILSVIVLVSLTHILLNPSLDYFFGNIFRLQGVFLLWLLLVFSLISSQIAIFPVRRLIYIAPMIFLFAVSLAIGTNASGRAIGSLGDPNSLAAAMLFLFPFVWFNTKTQLRITGGFMVLAILFLSGSRSGLIGFGLEILLIMFITKLNIPLKTAFILCLLLLAATYSLPLIEGGGWYENRAEVWYTSYEAGFQNPILGSGFGNIEASIQKGAKILGNNVRFEKVDSSHNIFLDWWIQGGLTGIGILTVTLITSIIGLARQKRTLELTILLGLIAALSFNPASIVTLIQFWWILGQGYNHKISYST